MTIPFFIVAMTHPDGDGWGRHVGAHVRYPKALVERGVLRASGPLNGNALRAGFLIIVAETRKDVEALVSYDPFAIEGLNASLTIQERGPSFGAFADGSTGSLAGLDDVS